MAVAPGTTSMTSLLYAFRALRRNRSLAIISVITLAFGIGATTAIFSIVNAILLRPLPYLEPGRLVVVLNHWDGEPEGRISPAEAFDYAERLTTTEHLGFYATGEANLTGSGTPQRIRATYQSHGVFAALGVAPIHGRFFSAEEDAAGRGDTVVLSHDLWRDRFGSEPSVLGQKIVLSGSPVTIVGVMPATFRHPADIASDENSGVFLPLALDRSAIQIRGSHFLHGLARLRDGATLDGASAEMRRIAAEFRNEFPNDYPAGMNFTASMVPMHRHLVGSTRPVLMILLMAVGLVLVIACANVANLLLVGADVRRRELAVRTAMGAERRHLLQQFLVEGALLALAGGALGVALTWLTLRVVPGSLPSDLPVPASIAIDWTVLGFAFAISAAVALVMGVLPAVRTRESGMNASLREQGRSSTTGRTGSRFRSALIIAEVAMAVVLSLGAGLLLRTLDALYSVDPGFRTDGVLTFRVGLPPSDYQGNGEIVSFYKRLMESLAATPGVESAGGVTNLPLGTTLGDLSVQIEGRFTPDGEPKRRADWQAVTPGYFDTLGMQILRGRGIERRDDENAPGAVVINQSLARKYWPGANPIGIRMLLGGEAGPGWVTIVGIVRDIRHAELSAAPLPEMYIPHAQFRMWGGGGAVGSMYVVVKSSGTAAAVAPAVRSIVAAIDPNLPISNLQPLAAVRAESVARPRFVAALFSTFSTIALIMAAIGVYGVLAFLVAKRTKEIGIRVALGARRESVVKLVLMESLRLTIPGLAAGLLIAFALARTLTRLLYGVEPIDPITFVGVAALLLAVSLLATAVPAFRAARVQPTTALRAE